MKRIIIIILLFSFVQSHAQIVNIPTVIVIGENEPESQVIPSCPYITQLAGLGTLFLNYSAITHPSQPNYIDLFAAIDCGVKDDNNHGANSITQANIWTALHAFNKTTEIYLENIPAQGSLVFTSGNLFAAKHNYAYVFGNAPDSIMKPWSMIKTNLASMANVTWLVPNLCDDGHGVTGVCSANPMLFNDWLKTNPQMQWYIAQALAGNIRLFIIFDEGSSSDNHVVCALIGGGVQAGKTVSTAYNHYTLNATLLSWYGAPAINLGVGLTPMTGYQAVIDTTTHGGGGGGGTDTTHICYTTIHTTRDSISTGHIPVTHDSTFTVHTTVGHDSTYIVACDTTINPPPPPPPDIWRGIYVDGLSSIAGNTTKENALILDLKRWKINYTAFYEISGSNAAALDKLFKRIRKETSVTDLAYTGSSMSEFNTSGTWNKAHDDSARYDSWITEIEAYNAADVPTAWSAEEVVIRQMKAAMAGDAIDRIENYSGWWTKAPMTTQTPDTLVKYFDWTNLHDYQTTPSINYGISRYNDLSASAVKQHKIFIVRPLFSAEPSFMQTYLKTHTLDQAYQVVKTGFDALHLPNLVMDGYIVFDRSFLLVSQPAPAVNTSFVSKMVSVFANKTLPQFATPGFKNVTLPTHLQMAEEQR